MPYFLMNAYGEELDIADVDLESPDEGFVKQLKKLKAKKLSDLAKLSPFSDVVVIQRRFMPKTNRGAFSVLSTFNLSSAFFLNPGIGGRASYNFLEKHGVEIQGYYVFTINRAVTNQLANIGARVKEQLPVTNAFFGIAYQFLPSYGKVAFFNWQILSFDTFFTLGGGMSAIQQRRQTIVEPTTSLGIGQVFAITRDLGLRWDLKWHLTIETRNNYTLLNDILFSIGFSYYYPSAGLR